MDLTIPANHGNNTGKVRMSSEEVCYFDFFFGAGVT